VPGVFESEKRLPFDVLAKVWGEGIRSKFQRFSIVIYVLN
jgi:hypothetical protein